MNSWPSSSELSELAFQQVFRTELSEPGWFLFESSEISSEGLRRLMVEIKTGLTERLNMRDQLKLNYAWLGRFNQQETTPFHRDNAGESSYLMLGYEPSDVSSELWIADYARFCNEREISPETFYSDYNPVYFDSGTDLRDYVERVPFRDSQTRKIVLFNNSNLPDFGVLHKAVVNKPNHKKSRVINSMMLNAVELSEADSITIEQEAEFQITSQV